MTAVRRLRRPKPGPPWVLTHYERPLPMNKYRSLNRWDRGAHDRGWRSTFMLLATHARIPAQTAITVTVVQTCRHHSLPDIGACFPAAKAAIDGLVDAGVIPDDDPTHLVYLGFAAPERGDEDRLILIIEPAPPASSVSPGDPA